MRSNRIIMAAAVTAAVLSLTGCNSYHADTPEFTTANDRDTGFVPNTFSDQHETENENLDDLSNKVSEGISDVESSVAGNEQFNQYSQELEEGIEEVEEGISQFIANQ